MTVAPGAPDISVLNAAAPPKKRGLLVGIVIGAVALAALGGGAWFMLPKLTGTAQAKTPPAERPVKVTTPLGAVVVNVKGEGRKYLRVGISLGLSAPADAKHVEEHKPQLLDLLISVLSATDVDTLTSDEGKTKLKDELLEQMHTTLHLENVLRVYFTEFVIQ